MYFVPNKYYDFVYLVLRSGSTYRHPLNFAFDEPFEIVQMETMRLRSTDEELVPLVGCTDKRNKGRVFIDNNGGEWYQTENDIYSLREQRIAHASVWNHETTSHTQKQKLEQMFITEFGTCLTHLLEISTEVGGAAGLTILDICSDLMKVRMKLILNT